MTYLWDIENPQGYANRMGRYKTKVEFNFISIYLNRNKEILDVGGGSGRFAIPLHQAGHKITIVERNSKAIDILMSRCPEVRYIQGDFKEVELSQKYDLIIAIEVMPEMKDWPCIFQKVHTLLQDNGIFIFTVINKLSWRTKARHVLLRTNVLAKDYEYFEMSPSEYFDIITKHSFIIDRCDGFEWMPLNVNSNSKLVDVFSWIESRFQLGHWIAQSPWLLFAVRR